MNMDGGIESLREEQSGLAAAIRREFLLEDADIRTYSPLTLAYIGDGIYDMIIRTILVEYGNAHVNRLHKKASGYVKAKAQKELFFRIEKVLSEEEFAVYKRGRNARSATVAKNASVSDYRIATGVEALFGYLYLLGRQKRIFELLRAGFPELTRQPGKEGLDNEI